MQNEGEICKDELTKFTISARFRIVRIKNGSWPVRSSSNVKHGEKYYKLGHDVPDDGGEKYNRDGDRLNFNRTFTASSECCCGTNQS